jgi:type VI secretion system Hcp family effector
MRNEFFLVAICSIIVSLTLIGNSNDAHAAIYVKIPGVNGDVTTRGYEGWFSADSFSFGVEREMKESGEKGGTADINIGLGELQEVTISKSMDSTSTVLAQYAINGNSAGTAEIDFVEVAGDGAAHTYLKYKLDRCFVKSWSTSGDADDRPTEEVAFYYNKIAFSYNPTTDGKTSGSTHTMAWDNVKNVEWTNHGLTSETATLTR